MDGPRIAPGDLKTWAGYLLGHALGGIRPDDVVMIKGEPVTWPLLSELQDGVFAAGAVADVLLVPPDNDRGRVWGAAAARFGTVDQIGRVPDWHRRRYEAMTKYVEVLGAERPELFTDLPSETGRALVQADEPFKNIRLAKPWALTLYPTAGFAAMEGLSLEAYTEVIVAASTVDPRPLAAAQAGLARLMGASRRVRVQTARPGWAEPLELTMDISGRRVVSCTGERNFPDGEVFTSPDARTVEGAIWLDLPVLYAGTVIRGVYLAFQAGQVVDWSAEEGGAALGAILETDAGSRRLGEVALGTNPGLKRALRHPLFVEKVGGTLHIALGASYETCYVSEPADEAGRAELTRLKAEGVCNESAQHVDLVVDCRAGGAGRGVWLDDTRLEVRDGTWALPG